MRFCMITTFYPPYHFGGDAVFVHRLSHALAERGHDVDVYHNEDAFNSLSSSPPATGYRDHPRVRRCGLRSRLGILDLVTQQQAGCPLSHRRILRGLFSAGRYDVIHFHNPSLMGGLWLMRCAARTDAVTLYTTHEHWLVCPTHGLWRNGREPCERQTCFSCQIRGGRPPQLWRFGGFPDRVLAAFGAVLAPSRFTLQRHRAFGMARQMRLLPNFAPDSMAAASGSVLPAHRPFFLYAGRLETLKGPHTLVDVFRHLPHIDLVIAGDGNERERITSLAADAPNVRLVGRLSQMELAAYYRQAQAVIVPSLCHEVFGLVAIEGFAAGTPAIVRDRGALPELIADSGAGFIYTSDAELRAAIGRLCGAGLRADLGRRARAAYEAVWTCEQHLERYFRIIDELRDTGRPRQTAAAPSGAIGE